MKKLLFKLGIKLIGMDNVYIRDSKSGNRVVILSKDKLSSELQIDLDNTFKKEELVYDYEQMQKLDDRINKFLNTHKGTVAEGKCFLAADDFVLGVDKEGKIKPVVDCTTNK